MPDVSILAVHLHGKPVATLTRIPGDRTIFAFADAYVADPGRPTLSLAYKDTFGGLITDFRPTRTRLLPFFSNLLPEAHMRAYLAERAGVDPAREFFLLWALGVDLPGAVTVHAVEGETWPRNDDQDAGRPRRDGDRGSALRFSLAGVQLKFSAVLAARGGLTIPARGVGGSWIVKLPSRAFPGVPENEYAMLSLARLVGIDVPPIRLVDTEAVENLPEGVGAIAGQALAVQRFDRLADGTPVHFEDFAQVFGVYPDDKYERASFRSIARVVAAEAGPADCAEFVRRLVFNALIGNADMHLKNWSLIYRDRRTAALAPAYDFVSTVAFLPDQRAALNFSRTRRFDALTEDELSHLAAKAHMPERPVLETARETVARFHQHWSAEKRNLPLPPTVADAIEAHFRTVPIARQ